MYEIERLTNHLLPIEIVDFLNTTSSYEIIIENIKETAVNATEFVYQLEPQRY